MVPRGDGLTHGYSVDISTLDSAGSVLMADTFDGQLPSGDCGGEAGPIKLRADEESVSTN